MEKVKALHRDYIINYDCDKNKWHVAGTGKVFISLKKAIEFVDEIADTKFKQFLVLSRDGENKLITGKLNRQYRINGEFRDLSTSYNKVYVDSAANRAIFAKIKKYRAKIKIIEGMIADEYAHLKEFIPEMD